MSIWSQLQRQSTSARALRSALLREFRCSMSTRRLDGLAATKDKVQQRETRAAEEANQAKLKAIKPLEDDNKWPRKIFSGIQPTGSLHLGNYLGAVQKWTKMQNNSEDVTFCIVDMHSITLPKDPLQLRQNTLQMVATMFACGIKPDRSTVFVQSAVQEHTQLGWILSCMSTMARLGHLPQFKEKSRQLKEIPLGLFVYPVLQAADIMLYKATHIPVGEDQVQHIQLAQHLARTFNARYGQTFPICHAVIENKDAGRIRSLRDPSKKMSKSDPDPKATINLLDTPEVIVEKIKKCVTDFQSDVSYVPGQRPGVSNLVAIHSLVTGEKIDKIVQEAKTIDTGRYKMRVADAVVEHFRPIRNDVMDRLDNVDELVSILDAGARKARETAQRTMAEVMGKTGLGALPVSSLAVLAPEEPPKPAEKSRLGVLIGFPGKSEFRSRLESALNKPLIGGVSSATGTNERPACPVSDVSPDIPADVAADDAKSEPKQFKI